MKKYPTIEIFPVEATKSILESKRSEREEFFVNLFEYCNLSCPFCWQDHDDITGMDRIIPNAYLLIETMKRKNIQIADINVMGGELFCDEIPDHLFDDYRSFARIINNYAERHDIDIKITWVTNLVYTKNERVLSLLEDLGKEMKVGIVTSYDPTGRFNKESLDLFLKNLPLYKDMGSISICLTRPNIKAMLRDDDEVFKFLYDNYDIYVDYYSPEKNAKIFAPSDTELLQVFYHLIDNYPNVGPIKQWIERENNEMTCRSSNILLPDGGQGKCRKLVASETYPEFKTKITEEGIQDNSNMEHRFLMENYCLTCEYFQRCGLGCYLHSNYTERVELDDCVFKITFDYITKGIKYDELDAKT